MVLKADERRKYYPVVSLGQVGSPSRRDKRGDVTIRRGNAAVARKVRDVGLAVIELEAVGDLFDGHVLEPAGHVPCVELRSTVCIERRLGHCCVLNSLDAERLRNGRRDTRGQ